MPSDPRTAYFKGESDKDFNVASMRAYVSQKQEMDVVFEEMVGPYLKDGAPSVLDACCGVGHVINYLAPLNPQASFLGVDQTPYLIDEARALNADRPNAKFEVGDLFDLSAKYPKGFDLVINWKTLSWLPSYADAMRALVAVARKHIFLSSLFYDGDIDFEIKVREYQKEAGKDGFNAYYNIISLPRFRELLKSLGAKRVEAQDFDIGIDLPRGSIDRMGTYTLSLADGKRLQMSGAVPMLWKIIRIDL